MIVRRIKLPALRPAILIATIFSIIGSFQLFNEPNILKPLAPDTIGTNFTPNMYAYNLSFAGQEYNYSAAIAIVMGVLTVIIAYVVQASAGGASHDDRQGIGQQPRRAGPAQGTASSSTQSRPGIPGRSRPAGAAVPQAPARQAPLGHPQHRS